MRCTTRVSSWPHSVSFVHRRPYTASSGSRPLPTSLRRRHTGFCRPSASLELQNTITNCVDDVASWMGSNRLQLNTAKTEILWFTTGRRLHQLSQLPFRVGTDEVVPVSVVHDLGIYIDSDVSMRSHVAKTVSVCFAVLRQLYEASAGLFLDPYTPVAGNVSRFDAAGLRRRHPRRHSAVPLQSIPVGDERCCSAGVFCVAVRPYHPTPPTTALAGGAGASRVKDCRPCL